jgi:hypothetical protein
MLLQWSTGAGLAVPAATQTALARAVALFAPGGPLLPRVSRRQREDPADAADEGGLKRRKEE